MCKRTPQNEIITIMMMMKVEWCVHECIRVCAHATIQDTDDKINKNIITKITQII